MATLTASGLDPCEPFVLFAASEGLPEAMFLAARGRSADEWVAAAAGLRSRGLLGAEAIYAAVVIAYPNPMGLPEPSTG